MKYYEGHDAVYKRFLDAGHNTWDKLDYDQDRFGAQLNKALDGLKFASPTPRALELGCGTGPVSVALARRGFDVTGIDLSETAIETARRLSAERGCSIRFQVMDVLDLARMPERYDLILDGRCLHCIVTDEDRAAMLAAVRSALAPGGYFVVRTMTCCKTMKFEGNFRYDADGILWAQVKPESRLGPVLIEGKHYIPNRRIKTAEATERELLSAGYTIVWKDIETGQGTDPDDFSAICQ